MSIDERTTRTSKKQTTRRDILLLNHGRLADNFIDLADTVLKGQKTSAAAMHECVYKLCLWKQINSFFDLATLTVM
jgi:hypothetical protein